MLSCSLHQILTLPSECCSRNRDSSDQATFFQSSIVQFWWACAIGWRFIVQEDNDPKHKAKASQQFLKVKKWNILQWPNQSPDFNPIEHAFHLLKTKLKAERPTNKQQLKSAAAKARQSITNEAQSLVISMSLLKIYILFMIICICPVAFEPLKMGGLSIKNGCNS